MDKESRVEIESVAVKERPVQLFVGPDHLLKEQLEMLRPIELDVRGPIKQEAERSSTSS